MVLKWLFNRIPCNIIVLTLVISITHGYAQETADFKFDRSKPIEITADSLIVTDNKKVGEFLGNVQVIQDSYKLTAHRIIVQYSDAKDTSNIVKSISAYKNIYLFSNNQQAAKAQEMVYNLENKNLKLSGDVLLVYDKNVLTGDVITVNTETRYITVTGSKQQRVKAVLTLPKE